MAHFPGYLAELINNAIAFSLTLKRNGIYILVLHWYQSRQQPPPIECGHDASSVLINLHKPSLGGGIFRIVINV
ncbi:hypothetical protein DPMN_153874 [Dreissena polymorpha]|uniref:Uncharacterized protein n=1 Tax=Dreissena polymorpha TaxID=45954 RepID=A0A9D4FJY1_DREPO|nr:hypothetical protein DPMN_153874 [Dreissena polymorpha]